MTKTSGQSLVETVIAAGLISVGILAALSLATRSQRQNDYAKNLSLASNYASEATDYLRSERTLLGWPALSHKASLDAVNNLATYCLNTLPSTPLTFSDLVSGDCSDHSFIPDQSTDGSSIFTRSLTIDTSDAGNGVLHLTTTVSWVDQQPRLTKIEMELTSWQ